MPEAGDKISAIRVISEMREASAEIDPALLVNGNGNGNGEDAEGEDDSAIEDAVSVGADDDKSTEDSSED